MGIKDKIKLGLKALIIGAIIILVLIPVQPFLDAQLINNTYAIAIKILLVGILLGIVDYYLEKKLKIRVATQ